jgi:hypothetical protein
MSDFNGVLVPKTTDQLHCTKLHLDIVFFKKNLIITKRSKNGKKVRLLIQLIAKSIC